MSLVTRPPQNKVSRDDFVVTMLDVKKSDSRYPSEEPNLCLIPVSSPFTQRSNLRNVTVCGVYIL